MEIRGPIRQDLTISSILQKISEYDIYRLFFGPFELNQITCNHLRGDKTPSFIIGNKYGNIGHFDFADGFWRGDAFNLVKQKHGCDLNTALNIIDREFGLGLSNNPIKEYKSITSSYEQPIVTKRNTIIQVVAGKFTKEELSYWNEYHQDITDLRDNNIYHIKTLYLNRKRFSIKETELRFGYYYPDKAAWKIYFPFRKKRDKWLGNVPLTTTYGLENLNKDQNTLVCKSLKDFLVCRKIYPNTCHVQNESLGAFSNETVDYINNNSKEIFCCFDSDNPGKIASFAVTKAFGWKHVNSPDYLLPEINDMAEWGRVKGLEEVKQHLINKKVIL